MTAQLHSQVMYKHDPNASFVEATLDGDTTEDQNGMCRCTLKLTPRRGQSENETSVTVPNVDVSALKVLPRTFDNISAFALFCTLQKNRTKEPE